MITWVIWGKIFGWTCTQEVLEEQEAWRELTKGMVIEENGPSYENTVIWAFSDRINDQDTYLRWQTLLSIPPGFGISCCSYSYIESNFDNLKSKYLLVVVDGLNEEGCKEAGYLEIGAYNGYALYMRE